MVAALLHDVGKTKTLTPDMTRTAIGRLVDHSQLTLELCAEPLRKLECRAPGIAYHLRHAWTCYSPGARFGAVDAGRRVDYQHYQHRCRVGRKASPSRYAQDRRKVLGIGGDEQRLSGYRPSQLKSGSD